MEERSMKRDDQLEEFRRKGRVRMRRLLRKEGGTISTEQVACRLWIPLTRIVRERKKHKLLGVWIRSCREWR